MKRVRCRIDYTQGMGGFLNPPGHPEHTIHVETDLDRRKDNRGGMCLSAAVTSDWVDLETQAQAKGLLDGWAANRTKLEAPEIQAWVLQVLGYYKGCYRNPNVPADRQWNASDVLIDWERDPMFAPGEHCGVRQIREFYPEFEPTAEHFNRAQWGE